MVEVAPGWFPFRASILVYAVDTGESSGNRGVLRQLQDRFGGVYSEELGSLEIKDGLRRCIVKALSDAGTNRLLVAVGSSGMDLGNPSTYASTDYDMWIRGAREAVSNSPDYTVSLTLKYNGGIDDEDSFLNHVTRESGHRVRSAGKVGSCLLAALEGNESPLISEREFSCIVADSSSSRLAWEMCFEVCALAGIRGSINRLYSERRPMLSQMDASEDSTQVWINELLARMRKPIDEIRSSDLEEALKEITIQFSRLSTLTNSMRRDQVKAKALIRDFRRRLSGWNEKPFKALPTITAAELAEAEDQVAPFGDFIDRTEALTAQFDTVLDSVRTYLGIQQQKLSISEQSSSREQLVQLVSLQETLHKLEVLVVAFYMTEMARIFFETVSGSAALLTALFIPVALVASVFLSRLLSRKR